MNQPLDWTRPSPQDALARRRDALAKRLDTSAAIFAGCSQPRNFPHNTHPFRAESHFLFLVGRPIEGAVLVFEPGGVTLYVPVSSAEMEVWVGAVPSPEALGLELGLRVRPLAEFELSGPIATLPPQDAGSASVLAELLGRPVAAGAGDRVEGPDRGLADALVALRLRHDDAALAQLRQAAEVTARAHRAGMAVTQPGVREARVRAAMELPMLETGMVPAYFPIVTTHGQVLHNQRHDRVLAAGDLLLADVGAETAEGWACDVTRTWPVSGKFSKSQRELYDVVLQAKTAAIEMIRPGVRYLDVHRRAGLELLDGLIRLGIAAGSSAELLELGVAALFFPHGVGHLLGLDVHDMEDLGDRAGYAPGRVRQTSAADRYLRLDRDLEPDMVVTIEPGFYQIPALLRDREALGAAGRAIDWQRLAGYGDVRGIRIEDDVRVTADGFEVLTLEIPTAATEIEALVACG